VGILVLVGFQEVVERREASFVLLFNFKPSRFARHFELWGAITVIREYCFEVAKIVIIDLD
jgi:hypothetical protein